MWVWVSVAVALMGIQQERIQWQKRNWRRRVAHSPPVGWGGGGPARARWHTSRCLSFRAGCRHPVSFKDPLGSCPSQWTTSTPLLSTRTVEEENRCAGTFSKRVRGHSGFRFGSTAEGGAGQYGSPRWNSHPHGSNEQKLQWKLQFQKKSCKNVKTSSRNFTHPSIL